MGMELGGEKYADSSATLGMSNRTGTGKVGHLRVQALWVQEMHSTGCLAYKKILGTLNPADALTKHAPGELLDSHLRTVGVDIKEGRAGTAPPHLMLTLRPMRPSGLRQLLTRGMELGGLRSAAR